MTALQIKALQIGSAILAIIALAFVLLFAYVQHQLSETDSKLIQALADKALLQADSNHLASSLTSANADKVALVVESEQLALQVQQVSQQKAELLGRNHALKNQLNQLLQDTTNEDAKAWRGAAVPNDVVRLLSQAADCAQRARIQTPVCVAARSPDARMPSNPSATGGVSLLTDTANRLPRQPAVGRADAVIHR